MNKEEQNFEAFFKSRLDKVSANRSVFERVTNEAWNRNTAQKSNYQSIYFYMNKFTKIGIPVVLIAIVAIVAVGKTGSKTIMKNGSDSSSTYSTNSFEKPSGPRKSADALLASFYADADADATSASAESQEDAYINSQIEAFTSFNQTNYENNI